MRTLPPQVGIEITETTLLQMKPRETQSLSQDPDTIAEFGKPRLVRTVFLMAAHGHGDSNQLIEPWKAR